MRILTRTISGLLVATLAFPAYAQVTDEDIARAREEVNRLTQESAELGQEVIDAYGRQSALDAEITEQHPDERVAWTSTSGARNAGVVTFHRLADHKTRVMLQVEYDPDGMVENVGDAVGLVSSRVTRDLERFKDFIESRQRETGAWRGDIPAKGASRR